MIFLSLGAGVQSSAMLMLALNGEIEKPDHVLFADTGWEPANVRVLLKWLAKQCEKHGVPLHIVSNGNIRYDNAVSRINDSREAGGRWASIPLFVTDGESNGMIRRQCTAEYKIKPIRDKQRALLGYEKGQRIPPGSAEVMIGISTDEARRASVSRDRWVDNLYPLIDPLKFSRADCQHYWGQHYPHVPLAKSACIGCPYRSDRSWAEMERENPDEFADAVLFDGQIRNIPEMRGQSFLHRSMRPLGEIDLQQSQYALDLDDEVYCAGGCGL